MKKLVFAVVIALVASASFGQKVNFSGTWNLNKTKSELNDQFSFAPNTIVVKHDKKSIELEKHGEMQGNEYTTTDVLTLDGNECENPGFGGSTKTSTVKWEKKAGILTISSTIPLDDGSEVEVIEKLSMDGENLVVEASASSSYGDMSEVHVFDKQ